jgi:ParB-like chromosome segregation protein Spo0J
MPFPQFEQMSRAEDERAAELYGLGFSQPEVAGALGRSRKAVRNALRRMEVSPRNPAQGQREWIERQRVKDNRKKPARSVFELSMAQG